MKGSFVIIGFFLIGIVCGLHHLIPFDLASTNINIYTLSALVFCVGFGIGNDSKTFKDLRNMNPRLAMLPVITILGTLAGSAFVSLFLTGRTLTDCLAIGSGFGYYSLSSMFITKSKGVELGTIALLTNITRELSVLLIAPFLAKWFGKLAPISAGGATTMDTTLPIITRSSGKEYAVLSVYHGFLLDFSVPFLVTLFCSM